MSADPDLLTAEEVAAKLRVSPSTVSRWARTGVLAAVRVTERTIRFRSEDVDAMVGSAPPVTEGAA